LKAPIETRRFQREWAYAFAKPTLAASFKQQPGDFLVRECLPFQPSGDGQHVYLQIRKTTLNTQDVARRIQRFCRVKPKAIGYAGLKDKRAICEQWFSVDVAGLSEEPSWSQLESEPLQLLQVVRHSKRLRIGWVKTNQFEIRLRDLNADRQQWDARLALIAENALPNYFGGQRFGIDFSNVASSIDLLLSPRGAAKQRELVAGKRGFHYSVIRSYLFNEILSTRVLAGTWQRALAGEFLVLDGSHSFFQCESVDSEINQRLLGFDIHPSAALVGKEKEQAYRLDEAQRTEQAILEPYRDWIEALSDQGVMAARRELRVKPRYFTWQWLDSGDLQIKMELAAGVYATTVLRELFIPHDAEALISGDEE